MIATFRGKAFMYNISQSNIRKTRMETDKNISALTSHGDLNTKELGTSVTVNLKPPATSTAFASAQQEIESHP